ncbi:MAG: hypothetical protein ACYC1C_05530 [Chloroflexota bacterium]
MSAKTGMSARTGRDIRRNSMLVRMAWGVFLLGAGTILLTENVLGWSGDDWVLLWAGIVMLLLNGARYLAGMWMSRFTLIVGTLATAVGLNEMFHFDLPFFAVVLILIGFVLLAESVVGPRHTTHGDDITAA